MIVQTFYLDVQGEDGIDTRIVPFEEANMSRFVFTTYPDRGPDGNEWGAMASLTPPVREPPQYVLDEVKKQFEEAGLKYDLEG